MNSIDGLRRRRTALVLLSLAGSACTAVGQTPAYTITDIGLLPGYQHMIANNGGCRILNNQGQVICQAVVIHSVGDVSTQTPPDSDEVAVRYTPGIGLERLGSSLTQNLVTPSHINEQGVVMGTAVKRVWTYVTTPSPRFVASRTQTAIWRAAGPASAEVLAIPESVSKSYGAVGWHQQLNSSGSLLVQWFNPQTGDQGSGAYLADGWHHSTTLDPLLAAGSSTISALNDIGQMVGWGYDTGAFGWVYKPGVGASIIAPPPGGSSTTPRFILPNGQISGDFELPETTQEPVRQHAMVIPSGGAATDLHTPQMLTNSSVGAMTGSYVLGGFWDNNEFGSFRWDAVNGVVLIPRDPFEIAGGAFAVNVGGEVVGNAWLDLDIFNPWVWRQGIGRQYLRDMIGDPNELTWDLRSALDINDRGQIAVAASRVSDGRASILILTPVCRVDFDGSGQRTIDDLFIFINAWLADDPRADFDNSGQRTIDDLFIFINAWLAGCP